MYFNSLELKLMQLIDFYTSGEISAPTFEYEYFPFGEDIEIVVIVKMPVYISNDMLIQCSLH